MNCLVRWARDTGRNTAHPNKYSAPVEVRALAPLTLASYAEEMRKLGDRDAIGAEAAMAILREAERAANHVLRQLTEFIAATAAPGAQQPSAPQR